MNEHTTIWANGNLATMARGAEDYGAIRHGAMVVEGHRIVWAGLESDLPAKYKSGKVVVHDLEQRWVTPGLIDCHTHLVYAGNRAHEFEMRLSGVDYRAIAARGGGIMSTVAATRATGNEELFESAGRRLAALKREGVTTVEIKSGYGLDLDTEVRMLEVARQLGEEGDVDVMTTFLGLHALPPEFARDRAGYVRMVIDEILPMVAKADLADAVDAFCEDIGFTPEEVSEFFSNAAMLDMPAKLHADQLGSLGGGWLAASFNCLSADHLEYSTKDDVSALAAAGCVAVLLPGAFYTLREKQCPPVELLRRQGVPMAIATDCNPGSSPICSLLLILNMACTLFRLTPAEALAGVTRNAAKALGLDGDRGMLVPGKRADFVIWDVEHPAELAYAVGVHRPRAVVKNGDMRAEVQI